MFGRVCKSSISAILYRKPQQFEITVLQQYYDRYCKKDIAAKNKYNICKLNNVFLCNLQDNEKNRNCKIS